MWSLENPSGIIVHIPLQKKEIQIGRNPSSDLCLVSDQSVSRHHAKITVHQYIINSDNYSENSNTNNSICEITDQGSRFSTYIIRDTEIKLTPSKPYKLNPGDKIKFGFNNNIWTLSYTKLNILICGHNHDNKKNFVKAIEALGGTVFYECNSKCTHYVSICNRLTPKFIFAVINGLPITGKKYWEDFVNSVKKNIRLPNVNDYIITNACLPEEYKDAPLYLTDDRRRIFDGFNFIFFSANQCNNYGLVIKAAGGKSYLHHKFTFDTEELLEPNMIIIECCANERNQNLQLISDTEYNALQIALREKNRRMVHCVEILSAILFCSTKKYCDSTMKARNRFWNDSPQRKQKKVKKTIEKRGDNREKAVDHVHQKENQPVSKKTVNGEVNVSPKKLQLPLELSRSDTPVNENSWIVVKASQKTSHRSQSILTTNTERTDVKKNSKSDGETSRQTECGKPSSEDVSKNPEETDIKSSKDKKNVGTRNKRPRNKNKRSDLANYSKAGSGKPSTTATSKNSKKLKKKNLNQVDKADVVSDGEDKSDKSSVKTILAVPEVSRNKTSKDIKDEKFNKKFPTTQSCAEVRRKKKFEDILGVLDESNKISSKNPDIDKSNKQADLDDEKSQKAINQGSKGIKVLSNIQVEITDKNFVKVPVASDPELPKIDKKVETLNKKHVDQYEESTIENHEDNLQNIAVLSNDSSKKSSEHREDNLNKKRKLDDEEISQVPNKLIKRLQSIDEKNNTSISLLDDSFHNESQLLDDSFKTDKESENSSDPSKIPSAQDENASIEAGTSKKSEEILDISSTSEKSETDQINRNRTPPIPLKQPPGKRSYNLRSQRCSPNNTKVNNKVNSQLDSSNYIIIPSISDKLANDNHVSETIETMIISDEELIEDHEKRKDDDVNLVKFLIIDSSNDSVKNCKQPSQIYFPESQEHQDDCEISNADVHGNSESFFIDEDLESALLPSQNIGNKLKENNIKPNYRVNDSKASSSNKVPGFFFNDKK